MYLNRRSIVSSVILLFLITPLQVCHSATLDYIYIDSSADEAAGGHSAVRLGESVFHFQYYDDGLFLLVKDNWSDFLHQYNNLGNRTLSVACLPVSEKTFQQIKTQFLIRYLLQERRFTYFQNINNQLKHLGCIVSGDAAFAINGLGLFNVSVENDPTGYELRTLLEQRYGNEFFSDVVQKAKNQLKATKRVEIQSINSPEEMDYYTPWLTQVADLQGPCNSLALYQAASILTKGISLRDDVLIGNQPDGRKLTESEVHTLQKYRELFVDSIYSLFQSERPGKGEALLLQIARCHALTLSINHKRILTLFPFSEDHELIPLAKLNSTKVHEERSGNAPAATSMSFFASLKREWHHQATLAQNYLFSEKSITELSYNLLETTMGRQWEIERAERDNDDLRIEEGHLLPSYIGHLTDEGDYSALNQEKNIQTLNQNITLIKVKLQNLYSYNLFQKNCVTELFETIYSAFPSQKRVEESLGGYLEPGEELTFVPFESFNAFHRKFPSAEINIIPSFRKRYVKWAMDKDPFWSHLRESNTLTSTIYHSWDRDTVFLFFTDDTTLLRPLYGLLNLTYGAFGSLTGVLASPLDNGRLLKRAGKGMLFSLPELVFVNIRKGSFPLVVESK